jgi:AraC family ethanolamine operon transcriptional activator
MVDGVVDGNGDTALRSFDLATLGGVLRVCELELVLLDGNGPRASIQSQVHDESLFCTATCGFQFRGRFLLPQDWCLLGYIHATEEAHSWCHGSTLAAGTALTVLPEGISEFAFSAGTRISLLLTPMRRVQRKLTELSLRSNLPSGQALSLFQADAGTGTSRLAQRYAQLPAWLDPSGGGVPADAVESLLHDHVQALLAADGQERPGSTRARRAHYLIAQRAENFMRQNLRRYIYMHEICDAAGVSERALRYAFEDLFGTSPNRYLSMLRLCAACRGLSMADASRKSVKAVALSCGLWDLSRFADNYRRVFGELPRDTLMRAPASIGSPA